ncbi:MAG TPA: VIT domain-containing protein [Verrucomicrobiae bacterium]|nr:VIT domain-containing protein [Verrucomicrobiae bacterium]
MKRISAFLAWVVLTGIFFPVPQTLADGLIIVHESHWLPSPRPPHPNPPWPPRPLPPPPRVYAPLEVVYHHVNVKIDGQIATTSVDQEFYNPNNRQLEGTYLFPVPRGAQIDKFTMDIGGKMVEAELLPAAKARQIYEDIVRKAKDPALLEYADRDVFKVRIFPIEPNSKKRIKLSYSQLLKSDGGLVNYVYPLNTEKFSAKPIKDVTIKVEITNDRPLKSIYSPSHLIDVKRHGPNRATVGFETTDARPDTDFALYFAPEKDELGINLVAHKVNGEDGYFLLLVSPGVESKGKKIVPKDVAFVLDTSGSMAGKKLEQAKKALRFCVESLNDGDRFDIVRFSTEVEPLFDKLVSASASNREKADDFIKELKPIGGTAIDDALKKALALRNERRADAEERRSPDRLVADRPPNRADQEIGAPVRGEVRENDRPFVIIFLTDGRPTIGTTDEEQILSGVKRANEGRTRVFCFGIGTDVNTHLLDKITEETRAFSQYVLPEEDLEVKVSNFFSKIKEPVLANPTLKFNGDVRVTKLYPSPLPDLFRGDQLVLVGRYSGRGDTAVILAGTVNGAKRKFTYEVDFPREDAEHEFIPRLWATRRVGYLMDEIRLRGENAELRDEVTDLARKYGIVTPYTAYLIVEDEARRNVPLSMQSMPQLYSDSLARREAQANWDFFKQDRQGDKAVAGARYSYELKNAAAPPVAANGGAIEANRALGLDASGSLSESLAAATPAPVAEARTKLASYSQQGRFVAGKNFYQNTSNQWVDESAQKLQNAKRQRIQFNSKEYFEFAARDRRALPWLALGNNVQFVLDDTLYEIYDTN